MTAGAHDSVTLSCYALGVLDAHERRGVEQHLSRCAGCRAQVADFSHLRLLLDDVPREVFFQQLGVPFDAPKPSELVLQRALRQIRSEGAVKGVVPAPRVSPEPKVQEAPQPGRHRRRPRYLVAAAVVAALAFGAGAVVQATSSPDAPPGSVNEARVLSSTDAKTGVKLVADVSPEQGKVKVRAEVTGIPAGQQCQLVLIGKDGRREIARSWVSSVKAKTDGGVVDGSADMAPQDVRSVVVETTDGRKFVTAQT